MLVVHVSVMTYRVLVYPSSKFTCSTTSANVWLSVTGHLGGSGSIQLGKGLLELTFNVYCRFACLFSAVLLTTAHIMLLWHL